MGEYDCYCAFCCGPLHMPMIGSSVESALRYRDWRLQQQLKARSAGERYDSDDNLYDEYREPEDGNEGIMNIHSDEGQVIDDEGGEMFETRQESENEEGESESEEEWWMDDEKLSYDPRLVDEADLVWLTRVRGLGYNLNSHGGGRAYFTGPCEFDDANLIVVGRGDDPGQPEAMGDTEEVDCYQEGRITDTCVYPFHESCLEVFSRVLTGSGNTKWIDKDVLWNTFSVMARDTCLDGVDYGDIKGNDQCWESIAGEEFAVADPVRAPLLIETKEALQRMITENNIVYTSDPKKDESAPPSRQVPSTGHVDPFSKLSTEVLWDITLHLPISSVTSLATASPVFRRATRGNLFWKGYFRREMAWAWDVVDAVLAETGSSELDYRRLCLWVDSIAVPEFGAFGPFLGLANRRRIWTVCQSVANQYLRYTSSRAREAPLSTILDRCECLHTPFINLPHSRDQITPTQRSLWIYGWEEIERLQTVEAIWDDNNALVGLGVTVGTSRRILGMSDSNSPRLHKTAGLIHPGAGSIRALVIHSKRLILGKDDNTSAVSGITVLQDTGKEISLGRQSSDQRYLVPSEGKRLVGIEAQMDTNGVIMRLGVLQCADDRAKGLEPPGPEGEFPLMHVLSSSSLFRSTLRLDPPQDYMAGPAAYTLSRWSPPTDIMANATTDISPHETVTWYPSKLERLSFYMSKDGTTVLGVRVQFIRRFWEPKRYAGHRDFDQNLDPIEWPDTQMTHFDLCGAEGERVVQIAVSPANNPKAIQLATNRGHNFTAGAWDDEDFNSVGLVEAMEFHGLAISWTPKMVGKEERSILSVTAFARPA